MIQRSVRYYYYRMLRQRCSPNQLAAGLAVGVFIGLAVPYGLQIIAIVLTALAFRKFNRIAALLGCTVSNPLTTPFIYWAYYRLGQRLTGLRLRREIADVPDSDTVWTMLRNFSAYRNTLLAMGTAAFLVALVSAIVVYLVSKPLIARYQHRRKKRLQAALKRFLERAKSLAHVGSGKNGNSDHGENGENNPEA